MVREIAERLVLAQDEDRRLIERALHDGVHQHLVALAVNVQLAAGLADTDPAAARALLVDIGRDVRRALDESTALAQRVYPPQLHAAGLGAALRAAATSRGVPATVEVRVGEISPPVALTTVYLCWLEALERASTHAAINVRDEDGTLGFVLEADGPWDGADRLRDRVEALGGRLSIESPDGGGTRLTGALPLAR